MRKYENLEKMCEEANIQSCKLNLEIKEVKSRNDHLEKQNQLFMTELKQSDGDSENIKLQLIAQINDLKQKMKQ